MSRPPNDSGAKEERRLLFEPLESRILYSAAPVEAPAEASSVDEAPVAPQSEEVGSDVSPNVAPNVDEHDDHEHERDEFGEIHDAEVDFSDPTILYYDDQEVAAAAAAEPLIGEGPLENQVLWEDYALSETFQLHSKADSNFTIYLDFDGHTTTGTAWNNANGTIVTPAYSFQGDANSFTDAELGRMQRAWREVAEDFAPFDVNVTTEEPSAGDLIKSGTSDTRWGIRVVIGANTFRPGSGGVAYINSFNWGTDTPAFVFNAGENSLGVTISHEVGHSLGLLHDGIPGDAYYNGHGTGETAWASIMGASFGTKINAWSKGEYADADNQEDDLAIISETNGFTYRTDDFGDDDSTAFQLAAIGETDLGTTYGIIEQNTDEDFFSFWAGAGAASFQIDPMFVRPNLDILASLYDASGTLLTTSNPVNELQAGFSYNFSEAGQYFLSIDGTGKGDPLVTGYTDYSSLGSYSISGSVQEFIVTPEVTTITGSGSVVTHGNGDAFFIEVGFNTLMVLSEEGGATIDLDIGGTIVTLTHEGETTTDRLRFRVDVTAGMLDTNGVSVIANSLTLVNGATLGARDIDGTPVLTHGTANLANDRIDGTRAKTFYAYLSATDGADPRGAGGSSTDGSFEVVLRNAAGEEIVNDSGAAITYALATSGTATAGSDYTIGSQVQIDIGQSRGMVTISVIDDFDMELNETVIGQISSASNGVVVSPEATAIIRDDDRAVITIEDVAVSESAGSITMNAVLDRDVPDGFSVAVNLSGATAIEGTDFDSASHTLFFDGNAGEIRSFTFDVSNELLFELDETISVSMGSVSSSQFASGLFESSDTAIATILNDDLAFAHLSRIQDIAESSTGNRELLFRVELRNEQGFLVTNSTDRELFYDIEFSGTATAGLDYDPGDQTQISISNGESRGVFAIQILDDDIIEREESLIATISTPTSLNITSDSATALIDDSDTSSITVSSATANEDAGVLTFDATLSHAVQGGLSLRVFFSGQTATAGDDFDNTSQLIHFDGTNPGEVQQIHVPLVDDFDLEGSEQIRLIANIEGGSGLSGRVSSTGIAYGTILDDDTSNHAPTLAPLSNLDLVAGEGPRRIPLLGSDVDGDDLYFTAQITGLPNIEIEAQAYALDQMHGFRPPVSPIENTFGLQEKFILNASNEFFAILPDGTLHQWEGAFTDASIIARLDSRFHQDVSRLFEVADPSLGSVAVAIEAGELVVTPGETYSGTFTVQVTVDDVLASNSQSFQIQVVDAIPVMEPLADLSFDWADGTQVVMLNAEGPYGAPTTFTAQAVHSNQLEQVAFALDQTYDFEATSGRFDNIYGNGGRFFQSASQELFVIVPSGELRKWEGDLSLSPVIGQLDPSYYMDLSKIFDVEAPDLSPIQVTVEVVDGDRLEITPDSNYSGEFEVEIFADNGHGILTTRFGVTVVNTPPTLAPIPNQTVPEGALSYIVTLFAGDAEGDAVALDAEIVDDVAAGRAYALDQIHDFRLGPSDYANFTGRGERFFMSAADRYFAILPTGELYEWGGSFESSSLLAVLDSTYHADLEKLIDVAMPSTDPVDVTLSISGSELTIVPDSGYTGTFNVRVVADDGIATAERLFRVFV